MKILPTELILQIISECKSESSLAALALVNRQFHTICNPLLYQYNVLHGNNSALDWAAETGQMNTLNKALDAGAPLPEREAKGELRVERYDDDNPRLFETIRPHPISLAANGGHIHIVRYMISRGVSITTTDPERMTPLALAARNGDVSLAEYLLSMGASQYSRGFLRRRTIWHAAFYGHMDMVKLLISAPPQDNDDFPKEGMVEEALVAATLGGQTSLVKSLLATYEVQVNTIFQGSPRGSPLCLAARKGPREMVSILLAYGADPNLVEDQRERHAPLTEAVIQEREDIVELLFHRTANLHRTRALAFAVGQGNRRLVEILLRNGAPPQFLTSEIPIGRNTYTYGNWVQPLLLAARSGNLEIAELLCEYGADVNAPCSEYNGDRPRLGTSIRDIPPFDRVLFWVVEEPNEKMAGLLLEHGADPNVGDSRDRPPLMYALDSGNEAIIRSLLDHGADMCRTMDQYGREKESPRKQKEA